MNLSTDKWLKGYELVDLYQFLASVDNSPEWRDRADLVRFVLAGGFRVSELLAVHLDYHEAESYIDLNRFRNGSVSCFVRLRKTKRGKERTVKLTPEGEPYLIRRWEILKQHGEDLLFRNHATGKPFTRLTFSNWWDDVLKSAGISHRRRKQLSIHKGRHTFASWELASRRCNLVEMQSLLGHKKSSITADLYLHSVTETLYQEDKESACEWREIALRPITEQNLIRIAR